ncbi:MAG: SEL1-like repeat protein [Gemmatimonadales bacterium]|nr:SEL1-like repeat protein [Gemmatimonadales bacterium]
MEFVTVADGQTMFNVAPGSGDPFEQLLEQVRLAAEGAYDILGEMGRSKSGNVVYLARELEGGNLVAMKLSREAGAPDEFNLEVVRTLDGSVPGLESKCPECKGTLPDWDRFCFRCGADLSVVGFTPPDDEGAEILAAVKEATAGAYDIVGKMDRADGGGVVFFARDLERNRLVALRLKQDQSADPEQASYSIGETQVFRPLAAELGATQVAPAASVYPTPLPAPAPVIPSAATPAAAQPVQVGSPSGSMGKKLALAAGVVLLVVIAVVAFSGGDDVVPVSPPPAVSETPLAAEPVEPPPPAPEVLAAADSGTIAVGVPLPGGARLTIDGRAVQGAQHRVAAGLRVVALAASGYEPVRERIEVGAGQTVVWRPQLARVVASAPVPTPAPAPAPAPVPPPPVAAVTPTCARAVSRSEWSAALELCRAEAQAGNATAQRNLARLYDDGSGVPQDRAQAADWYQRAAAGGNRESQERLGYLYRDGLGVRRDDRQSASYFLQAAQGGQVRAQLEYGVALEDGKGVSRNQTEAAQWYEKASAGGSPQAARRLGRLYERGAGVAKDEAEAARWYRIAGERGDAEAQYFLGRLYKDGKGVARSPEQALEWFQKAAAQGHRDAANEVRRLERP